MTWKSECTRRNSTKKDGLGTAASNATIAANQLDLTLLTSPRAVEPLPHTNSHVLHPPANILPRPFYPCPDPSATVPRLKTPSQPRSYDTNGSYMTDTNIDVTDALRYINTHGLNSSLRALKNHGSTTDEDP